MYITYGCRGCTLFLVAKIRYVTMGFFSAEAAGCLGGWVRACGSTRPRASSCLYQRRHRTTGSCGLWEWLLASAGVGEWQGSSELFRCWPGTGQAQQARPV